MGNVGKNGRKLGSDGRANVEGEGIKVKIE
jgi:hypothetical protein